MTANDGGLVGLSVVSIDPHPIVRQGLAYVVGACGDLRFAGEAGDARAAYALVERTRPDVALVEIELPGVLGHHATPELRRRSPGTRVLVLTSAVDGASVDAATGAGVAGYVLKSQPCSELIEAIRDVARGRFYLAPSLSSRARAGTKKKPLAALSTREDEVFSLIVRGFTTEAIARELCISAKTVETHRHHINAKLGVHSTAELVRFAAANGLLVSRGCP